MACCMSEEEASSKKLDAQLVSRGRTLQKEVKLLLLGPGESGKSTIFKQLKIIQKGGGFTQDELKTYRFVVFTNCITQMRSLVNAAKKLGIEFENESSDANAALVLRTKTTGTDCFSAEVGRAIQALWSDKGVLVAYSLKDKHFQLNDSASYFFDNIDRFMVADYLPTQEDVLRARVRTTGIEEAHFRFEDLHFRLLDVGGQRNERRKWIHCFDCVTAVLFCTSMSEYDQTLREDNSQNRMKESLLLFDEITNSSVFCETAFVLFLNKIDLFEDKIPTVPLTCCFPSYTGGQDIDKAKEYIRDRFVEQNQAEHQVFTHFTCAISTENVKLVFKVVKATLVEKILVNLW